MSDISFYGLGSFVLFLFTAILFGLVLLLLIIRQILLNAGTNQQAKRTNIIFLKSALIPLGMAILGLISLEIFNKISYLMVFDNFLAIAIVCLGIVLGISWLIFQLRKEKRLNQVT